MSRRSQTGLFLVGVCIAALACVRAVRPDGGTGLLAVGASAPDVTGTASDGKTIHLSSVRGHPAVVYFYPKDETPGCTREACAFRDAFAKYDALHVTIFGISRDSAQSHAAFRSKHTLPFPLVADEDGELARAYGVSRTLGMASRVTFLVGMHGIQGIGAGFRGSGPPSLARRRPGVHADQVLAAVDDPEKGAP